MTRDVDTLTVDCGGRRARPPGSRWPRVELGGAPVGRWQDRASAEGRVGRLVRPAHAQTTRTRSPRAAEQQALVGWAGHRHPLQHPRSVGSKGGFFQAEVGPVDGQSLSGLPGRSKQNLEDRKRHSHRVGWGGGPSLAGARPPTTPASLSAGPRPRLLGRAVPPWDIVSALDTPADLSFLSARRRGPLGPAMAGTLPSLTHESRGCD